MAVKSSREMKSRRFLFEEDSVPHALGVMALPAIVSQLITLIYNMADTWFVGRTNNPYMVAGCSLVLPVFMLTVVLSNVFGSGGGTLIARLIGSGEDEEASRVSAACIRMALGAAGLLSLGCLLFMTPLLRFLGASDNVIVYSRQYMLFVVVIGGIPVILSNTLSAMLRSIGLSGKASFGLSMGGLLNIALDPLFMFVLLPDGRQVMGAAIGIVLKVERLPLNIGVGICLGMVPLIAYSYAAGNRERMDAVFRFGRGVGLLVGIVSVILYYNFAPVIMRAFIGDAETVRFGTQFLRARCFATPLMFLCFSMVHFTQAIGRGKEALLLAVIRQLIFNIPILFVMDRLFGMTGIVWTQAIADIFTVTASYIIYAGIRRQEGWPAGI